MAHLRSWVVEGSVSGDDNSWTILDEEKNCSYLNNYLAIHTFRIENQKRYSFRFIRIRSTGKEWLGGDHLAIESFEIYGILDK